MSAVIKDVMKYEGLSGLLVGLSARMIRRSLMTALSWTLFEKFIAAKKTNS